MKTLTIMVELARKNDIQHHFLSSSKIPKETMLFSNIRADLKAKSPIPNQTALCKK